MNGVPVGLHGSRHEFETNKNQSEAGKNVTGLLNVIVFTDHAEHHAREHENLNICGDGKCAEGGNLRGDRGTDVRAHDHCRSLIQVHDSDVYEADDQYRGYAGALNQRCGRRADSNVHKALVRGFSKQLFDSSGCELFDIRRQQIHADEEHARSRKQLHDEKQHFLK